MEMKKILKIVGIIILALILIILIYFSTIHFNGFLKKDNVMTREEVVALLKKERNILITIIHLKIIYFLES